MGFFLLGCTGVRLCKGCELRVLSYKATVDFLSIQTATLASVSLAKTKVTTVTSSSDVADMGTALNRFVGQRPGR